VKFFRQGKSFTFQGRRNSDEFVEFARRGYEIHPPEVVNGAFGYFGEIMYLYAHASQVAVHDLKAGNFFTVDVILCFMPYIFSILLLVVLFIPFTDVKTYVERKEKEKLKSLKKSQ